MVGFDALGTAADFAWLRDQCPHFFSIIDFVVSLALLGIGQAVSLFLGCYSRYVLFRVSPTVSQMLITMQHVVHLSARLAHTAQAVSLTLIAMEF